MLSNKPLPYRRPVRSPLKPPRPFPVKPPCFPPHPYFIRQPPLRG